MRITSLLSVIVLLLAWPGLAAAIGIEAAVGGWSQSPKGQVSYKPLTVVDGLDLEKDARYDDEIRPMGRVKVDMPLVIPNIYVMATPMEFEGTGSKSVGFRFGDQDFLQDVPFTSKVTLDHYDVALFWSVPLLETATLDTLNVEFGINARFLDLKAEIHQGNISESTSESVVLPMLYLSAQIKPVEWLAIEAEGRGISISGDHYYDLIGRVKIKPVGPVFVAAGWRHEDVNIEESDIKADLSFSGPFLEGGLQF